MQIKDIYNKNVTFINLENDGIVKYCPPITIDAKALHPRVALKFNNNIAKCPYCSLEYRIK